MTVYSDDNLIGIITYSKSKFYMNIITAQEISGAHSENQAVRGLIYFSSIQPKKSKIFARSTKLKLSNCKVIYLNQNVIFY